jgi:hypothetical protein
MRLYELECSHGMGHSSGVHGCDGCCAMLTKPATDAERERIVELFQAACRCDGNQTAGHNCWADWAIAVIKGEWD